MSHKIQKLSVNEYDELINELNNLMIDIKLNKLKNSEISYSIKDLDKIHLQINSALRRFDKPIRT